MIELSEALEIITGHAVPLDAVAVPLDEAIGRILRREIVADSDSPPFDASAMDGYAARREDCGEPLRIVGEIQPGATSAPKIERGTCVRIFTGARVPEEADCVIMQEDTERNGDTLRVVRASAASHIRRRGENSRRGDIVLHSGSRLRAVDLAAAATCGEVRPSVSRHPRVAHLVTGNELVDPSETPDGTSIRDSNSILVRALVAGHGGEMVAQGRVGDDLARCRKWIDDLPDHDLLLISGGASVGDYDFGGPLLEGAGFEIHFGKLNLRPGKPTLFASRENRFAFGLPGNPVSHWVVFHLLVAPLLRRLQDDEPGPPMLLGTLAKDFHTKPNPRFTCWPTRVSIEGGVQMLHPLAFTSSGDVTGLAGANALLRIPAGISEMRADRPVEFHPCPI